jgi:hypothetical protein
MLSSIRIKDENEFDWILNLSQSYVVNFENV